MATIRERTIDRRECILRETIRKIERRKLDAWEAFVTAIYPDRETNGLAYDRACKALDRAVKRLMRSFRFTGRGYNRKD